ncbi:MAG: hypothetical protein HPY79_01650 [Bacteroidales bacterium]|nr:hypothetical protein [Bacteroidales bacterium]
MSKDIAKDINMQPHYKRLIFIIFASITFFSLQSIAQPHSIDIKPKHKSHFSIKKIFQREPKEVRKAKKEQRKKEKAASYNEIKTKKRFWKKVDRPKELATDKKVHRRMRKNLKKAERINKNKHTDNFIVRMSRKKIKLPHISIKKIHWPWTKKSSNE